MDIKAGRRVSQLVPENVFCSYYLVACTKALSNEALSIVGRIEQALAATKESLRTATSTRYR